MYICTTLQTEKKQEIQRTKLAENVHYPTMFWSELNKISDTVGNASGSKEIAQLFHDKYKALYNRVSTSEDELRLLRETLSVKLLSANTSIFSGSCNT